MTDGAGTGEGGSMTEASSSGIAASRLAFRLSCTRAI
ncbi:Uncharacterised protein [Mycobacterium tuberculosis]|nr:Uncharacterised protein [Mycobacterium tuberculosis]CNN38525.1 Uncharacterised protein [Mycobacterium tuberculosis]